MPATPKYRADGATRHAPESRRRRPFSIWYRDIPDASDFAITPTASFSLYASLKENFVTIPNSFTFVRHQRSGYKHILRIRHAVFYKWMGEIFGRFAFKIIMHVKSTVQLADLH